jgi:hypothetical protein
LEPGCFDEAVLGCDGVFHTASPLYSLGITDPQVSSCPFNLFVAAFPRCKGFRSLVFESLKTLCYLFCGGKKAISFQIQLAHMELRRKRQMSLDLFL